MLNIFFFSSSFDDDSYGGMESHREYFKSYYSKKGNLFLCSIKPNITIQKDKKKFSFESIFDFIRYVQKEIAGEKIFFFNDLYWIKHVPILKEKFKNCPFIVRSGGNDIFRAPILSDDISLEIRQKAIVKILNDNIDLLIINSDYSFYRNVLLGIKPNIMKKIRGGVDISYCNELINNRLTNRSLFDEKYNNDKKIICICSRFVPFKGIIEFLSFYKEIERKNYKLLLIGDGKEKNRIVNFLEKNFNSSEYIYLGAVANHEALMYISISDLFVNFSLEYQTSVNNESYIHTETMGRSLIEAISTNVPIFATNVGGVDELFKECENIGVLIDDNFDLESQFVNALNINTSNNNISIYDWNILFEKYDLLFQSYYNRKKVYCFDLDNTLVDKSTDLLKLSKEIKLLGRNSIVILNTCRLVNDSINIHKLIKSNYLICENGTKIYNKNLDIDKNIIDYFNELFVEISARYHQAKLTQKNCISIKNLTKLEIEDVSKMIDEKIVHIIHGNDIIKLVSNKYNKKVTLFYLLKDIPLFLNIISFGDSTNDIEFINSSNYVFVKENISNLITVSHKEFQALVNIREVIDNE